MTQRKILRGTVVAAWLVGALTLGRLVHEYIPTGSQLQGVQRAREGSSKISPRSLPAKMSLAPTSWGQEPQQDKTGLAATLFTSVLLGGLAAACVLAAAYILSPAMEARLVDNSALESQPAAWALVATAAVAFSASTLAERVHERQPNRLQRHIEKVTTPMAPKASDAGTIKQMATKRKVKEIPGLRNQKSQNLLNDDASKGRNVQFGSPFKLWKEDEIHHFRNREVQKSQNLLNDDASKGRNVQFESPFNLWKEDKILNFRNREVQKNPLLNDDASKGRNVQFESPFDLWKEDEIHNFRNREVQKNPLLNDDAIKGRNVQFESPSKLWKKDGTLCGASSPKTGSTDHSATLHSFLMAHR